MHFWSKQASPDCSQNFLLGNGLKFSTNNTWALQPVIAKERDAACYTQMLRSTEAAADP